MRKADMSEKLGTMISNEIEKNPEVYWKLIVPALANSKLNSADVICGYAEYIGLPISKTQRKWMDQHQEKSQKMKREKEGADALAEKQIREWKENGERVFSVEDFPKWVAKKLAAFGGDEQMVVKKTVEELMDKASSYFSDIWKDVPSQFCVFENKAYFTTRGYQFLIASSQSRGWIWSYEVKQWKEDSGLFAQD